MYKCAVTIDVDLITNEKEPNLCIQQLTNEFEEIISILQGIPTLKTTWFIRIDAGVEKLYGSCLWVFEQFSEQLSWLRSHGHILGWHFQSSKSLHGNEEESLKEVIHFSDYAKYAGVHNIFRIGNSIMTNQLMCCLEKIGVRYECSALPRPRYHWINDEIHWESTGQECYYPQQTDYQIHGSERSIIEIPMSTTKIHASYDSLDNVLGILIQLIKHTYLFQS